MAAIARIRSGYAAVGRRIEQWLTPVSQLLLRLVAAQVFLSSGLSKWSGFLDFNEQKFDLFLYEFFCPDPVRPGALLLCDPNTLEYEEGSFTVTFIEGLAITTGVVEVLLPTLLILGLFSRVAALGLIGMTLFIQLAVFPTWSHWLNPAVWWFVVLFAVFASGPGYLSLDRWLKLDGLKSDLTD
jgi:putative oxidoreductase